MRVTVRKLAAQDVAEYMAFLEQIDRETSYLLWEPGERKLNVATLRRRIEAADGNEGIRLVAEDEGRIIGFLVAKRGVSKRIRHRANFAMGVLRAEWGQGIGTRLLERLEQWTRENQIWRLELTVMANNQRAIVLYERMGYMREGIKQSAIILDGEAVDEIVMGKLLK